MNFVGGFLVAKVVKKNKEDAKVDKKDKEETVENVPEYSEGKLLINLLLT